MITKESLIKYLKGRLKELKEFDIGMDSASWGYQEGILITGNEAKEIIKLLEECTTKKK